MTSLRFLAAGLVFAGCASSPALQGYWVRSSDVGVATNVWLHLRENGTCEVSFPGEVITASYEVRGDTVSIRAQHEMRCRVAKREALDCVDEAGSRETFQRAPGRPAPMK